MTLQLTITRDEWLESIYNRSESENVRYMGVEMLKTFDEFNERVGKDEAQVIEELKKLQNEPDLYVYLDRYVQHLTAKKLSRTSIDTRLSSLKNYLRANGIRIYAEDMKQFVRLPKRKRVSKIPLTHEKIKLLCDKAPKRMVAFMLLLSSSGMRPGEALQLTPSCLSRYCFKCDRPISLFNNQCGTCNTTKNIIEIDVKAETTKTREQRVAMMSHEAFEHLTPFIQELKPHDNLLLSEYNGFVSLVQFGTRFSKIREDAQLLDKYPNGYHHVNFTAFRAFVETMGTKVLGDAIGHALIGHRKYLDVYFRLTHQERAEKYHQLEPYLTIFSPHKLKMENEKLREKVNDIKNLKSEVAMLRAAMYAKRLVRK